jgi:hypothetical protein
VDATQKRYWPFNVVTSGQRSEEFQKETGFLETAYQAGYKPYLFGSQNFGATAEEKSGEIIHRGCQRRHWEVFLSPFGLSAHLDDFACAAEAVLCWLRGIAGAEILERIRPHLFIDRVTRPGFVLYDHNVQTDAEKANSGTEERISPGKTREGAGRKVDAAKALG